jgi:hypothetical protein
LAASFIVASTRAATTAPTTAAAAASRMLYVSPTGDDSADGSAAHPFATLDRARDELRRQTASARAGTTVMLRGGTYVLTHPLDLTAADSGTDDAPVTWQAAAGEAVRIAGGPALSAAAFKQISDPAARQRLPEPARDHVVQLDLHPLGDLPLPAYPDSFRGVPAAPELFFIDQRMTIARWPNAGWATIKTIVEAGSVPRDGDTSNRPGTFVYAGDEPARWNADAGVWLQGYWCFDWYEETIRAATIDVPHHRITLARPALYGIKPGNPAPRRFRALNLLEELDEPGEFYIDRVARVLYFWPPAPLAGARVTLSTLNAPLVRLKDAEHVTLRGLTFEAGLADGIDVAGGRDVRIDHCTVRNVRELGINITGGDHHVVDHCDVTDTGTGGIVAAGGDRRTLTPAHHEVLDCHVWNFSRHQLTGAYAIILRGVGNRAAHNHVHDAPHQAILIDGNDHVFEYNVVDHVVTAADDAGALYKGRNPSCRGNVIRYNLFADIGNASARMTNAVYFDDGDGGDTVFGNVFLRVGRAGNIMGAVFSHGGHDIRVENNIFIDCPKALGSTPWDDARWRDALAGGQDCHWPEKLLKEVDITKPPYTTHYPELANFMNPPPGKPRINHARDNLLVRCAEPSSGNWEWEGDKYWQTASDAVFVNAASGDHRLRPDAEVFKHLPNFRPIPFEQIGTSDHR